MDIKGQAAIVTGGGSGLGAATAEKLASNGARVTLFDMNEETGRAHAAKIGATFIKVNVTDQANVADALAQAESKNGVARVLVNCAGIVFGSKTVGRDAVPHPLDQFRKVIEVNLIGTFNTISQFAARVS